MPKVCLGGRWTKRVAFKYSELQEAAAAAKFNTDQTKTDTPTLKLNDVRVPDTLKSGIIKRIHYRINPANAVTYTLRIWAAAIDNDYESNLNLLYESPSGQVDDEDYDRSELSIPFVLAAEGDMYYSIDWSAASGNVQGFIEVSGETFE